MERAGEKGIGCTLFSITRNKILLLLCLNNYTSRDALLALSDKDSTVPNTIYKLKRSDAIKENVVSYRDQYRKPRDVKYYSLTAHGFNVLLEEIERARSEDDELFRYAEWLLGASPIFGRLGVSMDDNTERRLKYLDLSTTSLIALEVGANFSPLLAVAESAKPRDEKTAVLKNIVLASLSKDHPSVEEEHGYPFLGHAASIRFTNARIIKAIASDRKDTDNNVLFSRFTGIFETYCKSIVTYGLPRQGLAWNGWIVKGEIEAYQRFLREAKSFENNAILHPKASIFVLDQKMFQRIIDDYHKKREKENTIIGSGYEEFTVFPLTHNGISHFQDYLLDDTQKSQQAIVELLAQREEFEINTRGDTNLFPLLETESGLPVVLGIYIDIIKIIELKHYPQENFRFAIICRPWQETYYEKVIHPQEFIFVE